MQGIASGEFKEAFYNGFDYIYLKKIHVPVVVSVPK